MKLTGFYLASSTWGTDGQLTVESGETRQVLESINGTATGLQVLHPGFSRAAYVFLVPLSFQVPVLVRWNLQGC